MYALYGPILLSLKQRLAMLHKAISSKALRRKDCARVEPSAQDRLNVTFQAWYEKGEKNRRSNVVKRGNKAIKKEKEDELETLATTTDQGLK